MSAEDIFILILLCYTSWRRDEDEARESISVKINLLVEIIEIIVLSDERKDHSGVIWM